jgi:hypothetical protein
MLGIQIVSGVDLPTKDSGDFIAIATLFNKEILRTEIFSGSSEPNWQEAFQIPLDSLRDKEKENHRALYLENLKVQIFRIYDQSKSEVISEGRIPLSNLGLPPQWYRLIRPEPGNVASTFSPSKYGGLLLCGLKLMGDSIGEGHVVGFSSLSDELSQSPRTQNTPFLLNFEWTSFATLAADPLPGPLQGETVLDRHETVEVSSHY